MSEHEYIYRWLKEEGCYTVGFYLPDGKWHPESDHENSEDAANRVHFLNGGTMQVDKDTIDALEANLNEAVKLIRDIVEEEFGGSVKGTTVEAFLARMEKRS